MTTQRTDPRRWWWVRDRNVHPCTICGCPLQRMTGDPDIQAAIDAHNAYVHPDIPPRRQP